MSQNPAAKRQRLRNCLAVAAIRFFGALPFALNRAIGTCIGWLLVLLPNEHRRITRINLGLCLPQLTPKERRQLANQSLKEDGRATLEVAWVWRQPQQALRRIRKIEGGELLQQAVNAGQPVVILAPHLGCWELLNFWLSSHYALHALYSPSGLEKVDALIARSREAFDTTTHAATPRGVVGLVRALKAGAMTAILPDQVPDKRGGHFSPFFGQQAATASLACRLIQQADARAFACFAKRLPGTDGFDIIIRAADTSIYSDDLALSLAAMNRSMEALIREAPAQYLWSYKRLRRRTSGQPSPYA